MEKSLAQMTVADVDRFLAVSYGRKVKEWIYDDEEGKPREQPLKADDTIEFHARLAGHYGSLALKAQEVAQANAIEVRRGWVALRMLFGAK